MVIRAGNCTGIDLHSNNSVIGIIDSEGNRIFKQKVANELPTILSVLSRFKKNNTGVVVESTYNWYWLVDGLLENGYTVNLANPAALKQYNGLKHTNDETDAFFLAELLRLGILKTGYIYPKETRKIRDLARKRMQLVQQKTTNLLSAKTVICRNTGRVPTQSEMKKLKPHDLKDILQDRYLIMQAKANVEIMCFMEDQIKIIEKVIRKEVALRNEYRILTTTPGVGDILATTIMLEVGDIERFEKAGNYVSYCRCVDSTRVSNNKKKGENNRKNGNKFLSWAYVEAANFAIRYSPAIKRYYQKKKAKTKNVIAIKAVAHKLARAHYHMLKNQAEFDVKRSFC